MATAARPEATVSPEVEAFVEGFAEGWRSPVDADAFADHFDPLIDPEIRLVQPQIPTIVGRHEFREQFARPLFELMPDIHGTVEGWAASGDVLYIEIRLEGTLGRRPVTLRSVDRITLRNGRALERVASLDPAPLLFAVARSPSVWPRFARQQLRSRRRARR